MRVLITLILIIAAIKANSQCNNIVINSGFETRKSGADPETPSGVAQVNEGLSRWEDDIKKRTDCPGLEPGEVAVLHSPDWCYIGSYYDTLNQLVPHYRALEFIPGTNNQIQITGNNGSNGYVGMAKG
ncbi:MAG: hypothetical protein H0X62_13720, partial [Bacteroidetes bacterium]|nr:hypothetical protein [Bacteroidota bacterium]